MNIETIALSLASGFAGAASTHIFAIWRERRAATRATIYSALRLAVILESHARACADVSADCRNFRASQGSGGEVHTAVPLPESFPDGIVWDRLPTEFTSDILSHPTQVLAANSAIAESIRESFDEDYGGLATCARRSAALGLSASMIASRLRTHFNLPALKLADEGWDHIDWLSDQVERDQEVDQRHMQIQRDLLARPRTPDSNANSSAKAS